MPFIPFSGEITVVVALWLQASPVCTDIVKCYTSPLLNKIVDTMIPLVKIYGDKNNENGGISVAVQPFVYVLKSSGFISSEAGEMIKSLLQDSITFFVCVFFCFMPWKVADIGVVLVGFVIPAYNTSLLTSSTTSYVDMQRLKIENTPMVSTFLHMLLCIHIDIFDSNQNGIHTVQVDTPLKIGGNTNDGNSVLNSCVVCKALGRFCSMHSTATKTISSSETKKPVAPFSLLSPFKGLFSPRTPVPKNESKISPSIATEEYSIGCTICIDTFLRLS